MKKFEIPCPYCHHPNIVGETDYDLLVGDGEQGDIESEGSDDFVEAVCENCDNEFKIQVYIPQYVYAELLNNIDYKTWLEIREIKIPKSEYYDSPSYDYVIKKIINSDKFPKELYNKKYRGLVDDNVWKQFIKQCWDKRDKIIYEEQE
jgi:hypothetical protein